MTTVIRRAAIAALALVLAQTAVLAADEQPAGMNTSVSTVSLANPVSLDSEVQSLKNAVLELNRELFMLEEELLYPANTQVAVFVSMDVGEFFALDSVQLELDGKSVTNYLYTEREVAALHRGGVQQLFTGNLKTGEHELIAIFTGVGPHGRDYRRGATLKFDKQIGAKFVELKISDKVSKRQPEFYVREWQ